MPLNLSEIGPVFSDSILALGEPPAIPWHQTQIFVVVPIVIIFLAGLLLGYIWFKPQKNSKDTADSGTDTSDENEAIPDEEATALRDEMAADFERSRAVLQGEKDAAEKLISQQKDEIRQRDETLALTQTQFEEKELRVKELVSLTKAETKSGSNEHALKTAKAAVFQLSETITGQRHQVGSGISRLKQIEDHVQFQGDQVWEGIVELERLQGEVEKKGGWKKKDLSAHLKNLEDHLRVHHQNASGCIQQAADARKRLKKRQEELLSVLQPVTCVEKTLNDLETGNEHSKSAAELETAADELKLSRDRVTKIENGVQQEIAELDGRVDWLLNDSSKRFVSSLDTLKEIKPPRNTDLRHDLVATERKLSEIRALLTRTAESPAASDAFTGPITPRRRINPAFDEAIATLQSAALTPATPELPEADVQPAPIDTSKFESELESLHTQLADEKQSAESLRDELEKTQSQLTELEERVSQTTPIPLMAAAQGPNLMRRLLGLGPDSREKARAEAVSSFADDSSEEFEKGMTGPQISISQLKSIAEKVDTTPINGRENAEEIESLQKSLLEKDDKITKLESELRQFTTPIPFPSNVSNGEESGVVNLTSSKVPEPNILPLSPTQFEPSDDTGGDSNASIPIPLVGASASSEESSILIFRGDDPKIWDTEHQDSQGNFAMPLSQLPEGIQSIQLKRLDNGESINIPVTRETLTAGGSKNETRGWSGKGEHYFGSMHLGIFDESLTHTVETKFGAGGWGFGHRYEIGSGQAFAWAGEEIQPVRFEITVQTDGEHDFPTQQGPVADSTGSSREDEKPTLPEDGLIVFRSNDPTLWNQNIYRGVNQRSRSLADVSEFGDIQWLKLTRCDTGESVVVRTDAAQLQGDGNGANHGFNGTNEIFYGAHHLGIFDSAAQLDVETRFTFGGWGFGHRNSTVDEESQACSWAGEEIPADTVFEMVVFSELPDLGENSTLIGGTNA